MFRPSLNLPGNPHSLKRTTLETGSKKRIPAIQRRMLSADRQLTPPAFKRIKKVSKKTANQTPRPKRFSEGGEGGDKSKTRVRGRETPQRAEKSKSLREEKRDLNNGVMVKEREDQRKVYRRVELTVLSTNLGSGSQKATDV